MIIYFFNIMFQGGGEVGIEEEGEGERERERK